MKKYTKKQILEAISYWKKQLKKGNYRRLNESNSFFDYIVENPNIEDIAKKNPYAIEFSYREAFNSYGYGVIAASSKEALTQIISSFDDTIYNEHDSYISRGPVVTSTEPTKIDDIGIQLDKCPETQDSIDAKAIVDKVLKGKYVSYLIDYKDGSDTLLVFEPHNWKSEISFGSAADDYFVEIP